MGKSSKVFKMTPPRYQEIKAPDIPEITEDDGTKVRLVCGSFWGKRGPVEGIAADPVYIDIFVPAGKRKSLPIDTRNNAFAYVFEGSGKFSNASGPSQFQPKVLAGLILIPPSKQITDRCYYLTVVMKLPCRQEIRESGFFLYQADH